MLNSILIKCCLKFHQERGWTRHEGWWAKASRGQWEADLGGCKAQKTDRREARWKITCRWRRESGWWPAGEFSPKHFIYFLKFAILGLYFVYFRLFKQTILTTNICEKMLWPCSIRQWDLNPRPSEYESPPITTRPGLPPTNHFIYHQTESFNNVAFHLLIRKPIIDNRYDGVSFVLKCLT